MIVVRIEMWPRDPRKGAYEIGRIYLANDGTGSASHGSYKVAVCKRGSTDAPREVFPEGLQIGPRAVRTGRVEGFARHSYSVWRLVLRALRACFPEEK